MYTLIVSDNLETLNVFHNLSIEQVGQQVVYMTNTYIDFNDAGDYLKFHVEAE